MERERERLQNHFGERAFQAENNSKRERKTNLPKQTNKQEMGMSQLWPCSVYISKYIKKKRRRIMKIQISDHSKHIISPKNKSSTRNQHPSRLS